MLGIELDNKTQIKKIKRNKLKTAKEQQREETKLSHKNRACKTKPELAPGKKSKQ